MGHLVRHGLTLPRDTNVLEELPHLWWHQLVVSLHPRGAVCSIVAMGPVKCPNMDVAHSHIAQLVLARVKKLTMLFLLKPCPMDEDKCRPQQHLPYSP